MKIIKCLIFIVPLLTVQLVAAAATNEIKGKHLKNNLTCEDCHGEAQPLTAAKQDACIDCHGNMADNEWIIFEEKGHKYEHGVHDSHESPIDCTKCHTAHKTPVLYCNTCHEFTNIKVP